MATDVISSAWHSLVIQWKTGVAIQQPLLSVHLFVNNFSPDCESSLGEFDECSLPGYEAIDLVPADWSYAPTETPDACGWIGSAGPKTYTFTGGGETIYGLWVYDDTNEVIAWSTLFSTPYPVPAAGGTLQASLELTEMECP